MQGGGRLTESRFQRAKLVGRFDAIRMMLAVLRTTSSNNKEQE
jgi:hypothetical protein